MKEEGKRVSTNQSEKDAIAIADMKMEKGARSQKMQTACRS
jgi:hypothetical protein